MHGKLIIKILIQVPVLALMSYVLFKAIQTQQNTFKVVASVYIVATVGGIIYLVRKHLAEMK